MYYTHKDQAGIVGMGLAALAALLVAGRVAPGTAAAGPKPYYTVEVDRIGPGGMNVLFDSVHHPETTDFAHNFGPVIDL